MRYEFNLKFYNSMDFNILLSPFVKLKDAFLCLNLAQIFPKDVPNKVDMINEVMSKTDTVEYLQRWINMNIYYQNMMMILDYFLRIYVPEKLRNS